MRYFLIFLLSVFLSFSASAQTGTDTAFLRRLHEYFRLNREQKADSLIGCFHPRMFLRTSRAALLEELRSAYDNESLSATIDSMVLAALSPAFVHQGVQYCRADYRLYFRIRLKGVADTSGAARSEQARYLQLAFPGAEVAFDKNGDFSVAFLTHIIGVKDDAATPWKFLRHTADEAVLRLWYPQPVIDYFIVL